MVRRFWVETLGCPKNHVDSDKLTGTLLADGLLPADSPDDADLVVVNTCAFIEEARQESIDTILGLAERIGANARTAVGADPGAGIGTGAGADAGTTTSGRAELVVTGCLAERYGDDLAEALPEADAVVGFGVPVTLGPTRRAPAFDLLNLPRPAPAAPWAYVKVAEGCDRACGFCAIPSFRGPQRSRTPESIVDEVEALASGGVREVVLVAQDLAAYGRDQGQGERRIVPLIEAMGERVDRVRLLYLYPSDLTDALVDAICGSGVPYFDLSLQHVSRPLLRRMRRWGDGERFLQRIEAIRARVPEATFRSNFIVGYPGETEEDHDRLLAFVEEAQLDWVGFFPYSREDGTYAAELDGQVDPGLVDERLAELRDLQDPITAEQRDALIGSTIEVLVDQPGVGRSHREAPEIDGVVNLPTSLEVGSLVKVRVTGAAGPDLDADVD